MENPSPSCSPSRLQLAGGAPQELEPGARRCQGRSALEHIHVGARPRRVFVRGLCRMGRWFPAANGGAAPAFHREHGWKQRPRQGRLVGCYNVQHPPSLRADKSPSFLPTSSSVASGVTPGPVFKPPWWLWVRRIFMSCVIADGSLEPQLQDKQQQQQCNVQLVTT